MKHIFEPDLLVELSDIFSMIKTVKDRKNIVNILKTITVYILSATEIKSEELQELVQKNISKKIGGAIMSTADN